MVYAMSLLLVSMTQAQAPPVDLTPRAWGKGEPQLFDSLTKNWVRPVPMAEGTRGVISATSGAAAARAGLEALKRGGTAIDAALTHAMADVVLLSACCVSHAGFMTLVYYEAASGKVHSMNAAWNTVADETDPRSIPGRGAPSGRASLVPGFMAGAQAAHDRFGKLPWESLFGPAIYFAEEGFTLSPVVAGMITSRKAALERLPATKAVFTRPDGSWYQAGDTFRQPELARTLRQVAVQGSSYMYRGPWAEHLVAAVRAEGGRMTLADLADYRVIWGEPAHTSFRGFDVYALGLPSLGGLNLVEALNLVEIADLRRLGHYTRSPEALYRLMRISRVSDVMGTSITSLRGEPVHLLARHGVELDRTPASRMSKAGAERTWAAMQTPAWSLVDREVFGWQVTGGTGHSDAVVTVDQWGNVAALLHTSNAATWGTSALFVDGVWIPDPGSYQQEPVARAGPGARLPDPTNPVIVLRNGKPVLASSSIGTGLQEQTLVSVVNVLEYGLDPKAAVDTAAFLRPLFVAPAPEAAADVGSQVVVEGEFADSLLERVRALGMPVKTFPYRQASSWRGGWVAVTIDGAGVRRAAAPRHYNGWALAH
jgi:gamma-glutamyltranspeptidase/glutathione hydrolase